MTDNFQIIKTFLPPAVIQHLQMKKFSSGEIILTSDEKNIFYIKKGIVHAVSHHEKRESFLPYRLKTGDIAGLSSSLFFKEKWWGFMASTDVEVIFLSKDILDRYILNNLDAYKTLVKASNYIVERNTTSFYIQIHGGARALFAYGLVEYSIDDEFRYIKHGDIAKTLNISRVRLHSLENEFIHKRLIKKERKKIIILNKAGLRELFQDFLFM